MSDSISPGLIRQDVYRCGSHFCGRVFLFNPGRRCPACGVEQIHASPAWNEAPSSSDRGTTASIAAVPMGTERKVARVLAAGRAWAAFQEGDSLLDQDTDAKLKASAIEARERLLDAINDLDP